MSTALVHDGAPMGDTSVAWDGGYDFPIHNPASLNQAGNPAIPDDYDSDTGQAVTHDAKGGLSNVSAEAHPVVARHQTSPMSTGMIPAAFVPRPPDPAVGGQPGPGGRLGWTTGLRTSRAFRRRFNDESLVIDARNEVHPVEGPVGFSTRTDRLVYGANEVLSGSGAPTNAQVTGMYASPDFAAQVASVHGMNPAYV